MTPQGKRNDDILVIEPKNLRRSRLFYSTRPNNDSIGTFLSPLCQNLDCIAVASWFAQARWYDCAALCPHAAYTLHAFCLHAACTLHARCPDEARRLCAIPFIRKISTRFIDFLVSTFPVLLKGVFAAQGV